MRLGEVSFGFPPRVPLGKRQDKFFQNLAFCLEPVAQGHTLAASSRTPTLVRTFLDLNLHPKMIVRRENGRPFLSNLR